MSAKLVVTLLATSLLTVGCVAYTDDPYYRGGYGYHCISPFTTLAPSSKLSTL
ncbi:hypothetical protein F962_03652 [Acinetobacter baumannii NIPH 190]|nr:hypothetical protein F962_03652 [Acinetobacter baumannii NIPH 190]